MKRRRLLGAPPGSLNLRVWRFSRPAFVVPLAILSAALIGSAAPDSPVDRGWDAIKEVMFAEALFFFERQPNDGSDAARSARFGEALSLLHKQPTTRENIDEVLGILDDLIRENPGSEATLEAAYLKARVIQLHPYDPNPAIALPLYQDLAIEFPETLLGQFAFVKAAGLRLYDPEMAEDERPFDLISREAAFLTDPDVIRSYNLLMAEASQRFEYNVAFALAHYIDAYDAGLTKPDLRANVLARIISLSQELGDIEMARLRAEEFRIEFPRDMRITMVEEFLADKSGVEQ